MKLARVLGSVTSTIKHPAFAGRKLLVVQPIDERGESVGTSYLAVDTVQAGTGDRVIVLTEGTGARQIFGLPKTAALPIRSVIVGVVDAVECAR
jgi:microcompartment protein CcmK/EutM